MAAWRLATVVFLVAALFNFPWELAQSPLYVAMPPLPASLWCCFVASLGDGVLLLLLWGRRLGGLSAESVVRIAECGEVRGDGRRRRRARGGR